MLSRRDLLKRSALLTGLISNGLLTEVFANKPRKKLHIGACDWSIGKSSDIGAFQVAKQIGLEGVQVNLGSEQNGLHLRQRSRQQAYLAESKRTGVKIAGLAISELNKVPYKSEPRTEEWVWDAVDVAKNLGVKVILLAFFSKNDLRDDAPGKREVIKRLRIVAPKAEKMGITLGIESYLSAQEHLDIMERVGSKSVKVYVDFRNSADAGYDVIEEIKLLGKDAICELHMKENGFLLGEGTLDWKKISHTLMDMDYVGGGWMQIEGARPEGSDLVESYRHNHEYLRTLFNI